MKQLLLICLSAFVVQNISAQCETWKNEPNRAELEGWHTIYKSNLESKDYDLAFEYWEKVYKAAPAADGKRASHYLDGVTLYKEKYNNATDAAKKEEYANTILRLYDEAIQCYKQGVITIKGCNKDKCVNEQLGFLYGRKAYDMYYVLNSPKEDTYETLKNSLEMSGNKAEYFTIAPFGDLLAAMVKQEKVSIEDARNQHSMALDIADFNIKNNKQYNSYFKDGKAQLDQYMTSVESLMYDCEYFVNKLVPKYKANKKDEETIISVYEKLDQQDCPMNTPILAELKMEYDTIMEARKLAELRELAKTNPEIAAQLFYNNGEFKKAANKYKEAIEKETDIEKKADYTFRLASIQGRKLNQYSNARTNARKAASLKDNWGRPYMLIGDLYAKTSSSCGDGWNQRLAVLAAIDKYAYAKSIDSSVASEANSRIANYSGSKPLKQDAHQRGVNEGDKVKVGCWISETVTLRF